MGLHRFHESLLIQTVSNVILSLAQLHRALADKSPQGGDPPFLHAGANLYIRMMSGTAATLTLAALAFFRRLW
jgi:hypothetical protein